MKVGDFLIQSGFRKPRATRVTTITQDQICLEVTFPKPESGRKSYHYISGGMIEKAHKVSRKTKVDIWKID